jgi:hypothetical protein
VTNRMNITPVLAALEAHKPGSAAKLFKQLSMRPKTGYHQCTCGATISANKLMCLVCSEETKKVLGVTK